MIDPFAYRAEQILQFRIDPMLRNVLVDDDQAEQGLVRLRPVVHTVTHADAAERRAFRSQRERLRQLADVDPSGIKFLCLFRQQTDALKAGL